jgi:hypothetical protein
MNAHNISIRQRRFISRARYKEDRGWQREIMLTITGKIRHKYQMPAQNRQLEYYFYTDIEQKAISLLQKLEEYGYSSSYGLVPEHSGLFVIKGSTDEVFMAVEDFVAWAEKMCDIGFRCDCEFDGWSTRLL